MKKIIIAKHVGNEQIYYWNYDEWYLDKYDYAIVESKGKYDLVKVLGTGEVNDDFKYADKKVMQFVSSKDWAKH